MARKKKHEEHENHERWLVSYADFITLLFAFFVVMYSISSVNEGKYRVLSDTMVAAFKDTGKRFDPIQIGTPSKMLNPMQHGVITPDKSSRPQAPVQQVKNASGQSDTDIGRPDVSGQASGTTLTETTPGQGGRQESLDAMSEAVQNNMASVIDQNMMTLRRHKDALEIELKSNILFAQGQARLSVPAEKILIRLAATLVKFPNSIQIEGHTDDRVVKSAQYPSNWELSSARASAVADLFTEHDMDPELIWVVGYAGNRPKVDNLNEETRSQNRRVVLMIRPNLAGVIKKNKLEQTGAAVLNNAGPASTTEVQQSEAAELNATPEREPMLQDTGEPLVNDSVDTLNSGPRPILEDATAAPDASNDAPTNSAPLIAPIQLPFPVSPPISGARP